MVQTIINNFQSIQEAKISIEGVTLIIGESNQGKSACLRALQAACTNRFKAGQVKHGEDHALIRIKVPESNDVLQVLRSWAGGSPRMKLGQQEFSKLGRTLPKEVDEYLNLGSLDLNGEVYSCNFHSQFQKPLLLEYSQQKVMELLSASSALDDLKETKEALMSERTKNKGAIQVIDSMIEESTSEVEQKKQEYADLQPKVDKFLELNEELQEVNSKVDICVSLLSALQELSKVEKREQLLNKLDITAMNYDAVADNAVSLSALVSLLDKQSKLEKREQLLNQFISTCDLKLEEKLSKVNLLQGLLESYSSCEQKESKLAEKHKLLVSAKRISASQSDISLKGYAIRELQTNLSTLRMVETREGELVKIVDEHMCPICGHKVDM